MYKTILSKSLVFSHLRIETFTFYTEISIWLYFFFTHENDCKSIFLGQISLLKIVTSTYSEKQITTI